MGMKAIKSQFKPTKLINIRDKIVLEMFITKLSCI